MGKISVKVKGIVTGVVLAGALLLAYVLIATAPTPNRVEPEEVATAIRVLQVQQQDIQLEVISQGTVVPQIESELIPEVSGRVQWVSPNLAAGGYFKEDEVLLKLNDSDYQASVDRGQAALSRAEAEEQLAGFELKRMQELVKNKLTSQSSLESVLRNHRVAEAALKDAQIALGQAERDLARTEIRAPYNGLVRSERVDLGQFVSRGQSIAFIYADAAVEVRLPVADRQLAYLSLPLGHRGELAVDQQPEVILATEYGGEQYEWVGRLVRTEAEIDARSRMVTAIARVVYGEPSGGVAEQTGTEAVGKAGNAPGGRAAGRVTSQAGSQPRLPIGLFVNATIRGKWARDVFSLPRSALRNQSRVLVIDDDNRLRYRAVEVMRNHNNRVIISAGINAGELVNISPIQTVIEGMKVQPLIEPNEHDATDDAAEKARTTKTRSTTIGANDLRRAEPDLPAPDTTQHEQAPLGQTALGEPALRNGTKPEAAESLSTGN